MSTPWKLYNDASKDTGNKFSVYRCPDPVAVDTGSPWYNYSNVCPCDPKLSNNSGRGFTACDFGIKDQEVNVPIYAGQLASQIPNKSQVVGNMFNDNQFVPPQLQPRQLVRIGQQWRNTN
jgi:hypothetical protein